MQIYLQFEIECKITYLRDYIIAYIYVITRNTGIFH